MRLLHLYPWSLAVFILGQHYSDQNPKALNPSTAGAVHIRFLHFILAHYISAFKPVK